MTKIGLATNCARNGGAVFMIKSKINVFGHVSVANNVREPSI